MLSCAKSRIFIFLITIILGINIFNSTPVYAKLDPKVKALAVMASYGTIGGALLGTASLAFGTSKRSIARGASLGLYAGIVFGSVVVLTHAAKTKGWTGKDDGYYPDTPASPYEEGYDVGSEGDYYEDGEQRWRFNMSEENSSMREHKYLLNRKNHERLNQPLFYINFLNVFF